MGNKVPSESQQVESSIDSGRADLSINMALELNILRFLREDEAGATRTAKKAVSDVSRLLLWRSEDHNALPFHAVRYILKVVPPELGQKRVRKVNSGTPKRQEPALG